MAFLMLAIGLTVLGSLLVWRSAHAAGKRSRHAISDYSHGLRALSQRSGQRFEPPRAVVRLEPEPPPVER